MLLGGFNFVLTFQPSNLQVLDEYARRSRKSPLLLHLLVVWLHPRRIRQSLIDEFKNWQLFKIPFLKVSKEYVGNLVIRKFCRERD